MYIAEDFIILQGHVYQHNKKKFDNRTLQAREIKKFPLFSEHTSYMLKGRIVSDFHRGFAGKNLILLAYYRTNKHMFICYYQQ